MKFRKKNYATYSKHFHNLHQDLSSSKVGQQICLRTAPCSSPKYWQNLAFVRRDHPSKPIFKAASSSIWNRFVSRSSKLRVYLLCKHIAHLAEPIQPHLRGTSAICHPVPRIGRRQSKRVLWPLSRSKLAKPQLSIRYLYDI